MLFASPSLGQSDRRIPERFPSNVAALQGVIRDPHGRAISGAQLDLRNTVTGEKSAASTNAEGIFRLRDVHLGIYELKIKREGFETQIISNLQVNGPVTVLEVELHESAETVPPSPCPSGVPGTPCAMAPASSATPYPGMPNPASQEARAATPTEQLPPDSANFLPNPDRWDISMPEWRRYDKQPDEPYVKSHWYDPFNRNRIKADSPIFGQRWFFNFTGTSQTGFDGRRLPVPSGLDSENPGSSGFFGRGEQAFVAEGLRLSFDLFRGDASFRPVDFRVRLTPEINLNFLQTRERGIVNIDPRKGTNRFDDHVGLQEGFLEAKIRDLSPNYDFVSVRAGIQQFTSDFRGLLFFRRAAGRPNLWQSTVQPAGLQSRVV